MLKSTQATLGSTADLGYHLGTNAMDHLIQSHSFYTLLPPNSPSCSGETYDYSAPTPRNVWISASSNHSGGVQTALLDASGRFISETINTLNLNRKSDLSRVIPTDTTGTFSYGVWAELGSINGGESTSLP
jgi:hypothetical protein